MRKKRGDRRCERRKRKKNMRRGKEKIGDVRGEKGGMRKKRRQEM